MPATRVLPAIVRGRPTVADARVTCPTALVTVHPIGDASDVMRQTLLVFNSTVLTLTDNGANGSGSIQLLDFPKGNINLFNVVGNLTYTLAAFVNAGLVSSIGTATAAADATLTSTEADVIASTATAMNVTATFAPRLGTMAILNGTGTATDMFLNVATANDPVGNKALAVTGWLLVTWAHGGDLTAVIT